jgi:hypothetical protein
MRTVLAVVCLATALVAFAQVACLGDEAAPYVLTRENAPARMVAVWDFYDSLTPEQLARFYEPQRDPQTGLFSKEEMERFWSGGLHWCDLAEHQQVLVRQLMAAYSVISEYAASIKPGEGTVFVITTKDGRRFEVPVAPLEGVWVGKASRDDRCIKVNLYFDHYCLGAYALLPGPQAPASPPAPEGEEAGE